MKRFLIIILAVASVVSAKAQFPGWENMSKVVTDTLYSEVLKADREFNVFLPQNYAVNTYRSYPVLYLLHGMNDTHQGWNMRGHIKDVMDQLVASGEACEMIIVTPNAGGNVFEGAWNGYFNMPGWAYEDFFFTEFLPYVEKKYRIRAGKEYRAIAGLSMGGGGATSYAQRHTEMFCAAYAMSALMSIPQQGAVQPQEPENPQDKMALLTKSVIEKNCVDYVKNASEEVNNQLRTVKWYVDCGDDDFLLDRNIEFTQAMRAARIPCEFRVRDGGHTWEYWHSALYTCLPFVTRSFAK